MRGSVTHAQITKIWACARELGLDRELLYLLVPRGSMTAMSAQEASELIEHLENLRSKENAPPPPNAATQEQRNFIYFLFGRLGWLGRPERIRGFLKKYAHVGSVEGIPDKKRASAVIEALKAISNRKARGNC